MIAAIHIVGCRLLDVCLQIIIYSRFFFMYFSLLHVVLRTAWQLCIAIRGGVYVSTWQIHFETHVYRTVGHIPRTRLAFSINLVFAYFLRRRERRRKKNARLTNDCDFGKASGTYVDAGRGAVTCYLSSNDNTEPPKPMEWVKAPNVIILLPSMPFYVLNVHTHISLCSLFLRRPPNPMSCICIYTI